MALFNLLLITIVLSVLSFLFFYLNHLHVQETNKKKQLEGLNILKNYRTILTLLQQHRGLTTAYLNGGDILLKRITPLEEKINNQIQQIDSEEEWLKNNLMWLGIKDHWKRLLNNYNNYESEHNFRQHCNLIINLLKLIEYCAEQHDLRGLFSKNLKNVDFIWSQLLITAENIGQIRAIGTSIAAAQKASNIQLIHLNYLQVCVNDFLRKPNQPFDNSLIVEFLSTVNNEIINPSINIPAEKFFNLATVVIDDLLSKSDDYLNNFELN